MAVGKIILTAQHSTAQRVECALFPVYIIISLKHQQICVLIRYVSAGAFFDEKYGQSQEERYETMEA